MRPKPRTSHVRRWRALLGAVSAAGLTAVLVGFAAERLRRRRITQTYAAEQADLTCGATAGTGA